MIKKYKYILRLKHLTKLYGKKKNAFNFLPYCEVYPREMASRMRKKSPISAILSFKMWLIRTYFTSSTINMNLYK